MNPGPSPANLPPLPIDDPHARVMNHEDLTPDDALDIDRKMLESADDFAEWSKEIEHLDTLPGKTPEDDRNHEKLVRLIDRPVTLLDADPAREVAPQNERIRSDEVRQALQELGAIAETKPQYAADPEKDPVYHEIKKSMNGMGFGGDKALILQNYRAAQGGGSDQVMQRWEGRKKQAIQAASKLLEDNPGQSLFFISQGEAYQHNADSYHTAPAGKETPWDKTLGHMNDVQDQARIVANHPGIPDESLEAAGVRVHARNATTAYQEMKTRAAASQVLNQNYKDLLKELPLDFEDGNKAVVEFQKDFETKNGYKIEDAVSELREGKTFEAFLTAAEGDDRARAEQPLWRDIQYTGRALSQLHDKLKDMQNSGMSLAHSHYRELYNKAQEIQQVHAQSWQRWQSLRITNAAWANPTKSDFKGRAAAVIYSKDGDKGIYVVPPRGEGTTIVYPDNSTRTIDVDPAGTVTTHDRKNLNGTDWEAPDPLTLNFQEAQPLGSTTSLVGRVSLGAYNSLAPNEKRIDNRDLPALVGDLAPAELAWRMNPSDTNTVQQFYDLNRLINQRIVEATDRIQGDGSTPIDPAEQSRLDALRIWQNITQYRIKYLEHGTEGDQSVLSYTGSVNFQGELHNTTGNWQLMPTGYAWLEQTTPAGSTRVLYESDGTIR